MGKQREMVMKIEKKAERNFASKNNYYLCTL